MLNQLTAIFLVTSVILSGCGTKDNSDFSIDTRFRYEVTQIAEGRWGYLIYDREKIIIEQPFIPAVPGFRPFSTREQAECVAHLVVNKLSAFSGRPAAVSIHELDSLKVKY